MTYVGLAHLLYVMLCLRVLVMFAHKLRFAFLAFVCCCVHQLWESGVCVLVLRPVVCTCAFLLRIGYSISCLDQCFARGHFSRMTPVVEALTLLILLKCINHSVPPLIASWFSMSVHAG